MGIVPVDVILRRMDRWLRMIGLKNGKILSKRPSSERSSRFSSIRDERKC
jgi:hypothetical protein